MSTDKQETYLQCQHCGNIYMVTHKYSIEDSIVECRCPKCKNEIALNLGEDKDDIYLYYNVNVDGRYY